jgi:sugar-specific transcriptional regulator TrmB
MASLRDLGLSEYESRAFHSLLETGPTTAKELSRSSDVPMGRIYDVLNSLETQDLVRSQTASRPKKYVAVETETALQRLVSAKQRELEEKAQQYEVVAEELAGQLERGDTGEEPFWTVAMGPEDASELLVDRLRAAEDRLYMVASAPGRPIGEQTGKQFVEAAAAALDRGVSVSFLLHSDLLDAFPPETVSLHHELVGDRENFEWRTSDGITGTFELIDRTEVCIEVANPLGGETLAVIDLTDPEFAADVETAFEEHWAEAEPVEL